MAKVEQPKGVRDYLPEEQIIINNIIDTIKATFEKYGFSPLDTPALETYQTLTRKGTGGEQIGKEIFTLTDRAKRKLGLRFDLTVPLARVLASNPTLTLPFKRYQIAKVWREEFGSRSREFWQCDVDTVGSSSLIADAEMLAIVQDVFRQLGIKVKIKYSSRNFLVNKLKSLGIPESSIPSTIQEIDKLDKGTSKLDRKIVTAIRASRAADDPEVKGISSLLRKMKVKAEFDPTLARGLDYYTGPVFEVFSEEYKYSIAGGGRYDNLIKQLGGRDLPATGISLGVTRIYEIVKAKQKSTTKTVTQLYLIPIRGPVPPRPSPATSSLPQKSSGTLSILSEFRAAGINADSDLMGRSLRKNLDFANKQNIPYVAFVGPEELKKGKIKLKNMKTGEEQLLTVAQATKLLKKVLY